MNAWRAVVFVAVACGACGGSAKSWTSLDTTTATDLSNAALSLESICARDGGPCPVAAVRSVETGEYCAAAAMLYRHNQAVPDGGAVGCLR